MKHYDYGNYETERFDVVWKYMKDGNRIYVDGYTYVWVNEHVTVGYYDYKLVGMFRVVDDGYGKEELVPVPNQSMMDYIKFTNQIDDEQFRYICNCIDKW